MAKSTLYHLNDAAVYFSKFNILMQALDKHGSDSPLEFFINFIQVVQGS